MYKMVYDIRDYGAVGDGTTINTKSIQKAIDDCTQNGGGRVLVSGGTYVLGTIILKENVDLHIAAGGILICFRKEMM